MTNLKRALIPIRLAIPSLLALSATAAWSPQITTSGTGFWAMANTSLGRVGAGYDRPGVPISAYSYAGWYPCGGGSITYTFPPGWFFGDDQAVTCGQSHPPACTQVALITDGDSGTGSASIFWSD